MDHFRAAHPAMAGERTPNRSQLSVRDDDMVADVDEPPDSSTVAFAKRPNNVTRRHSYDPLRLSDSSCSRQSSLLTQALLTSPEMGPISDAEMPSLISDGGFTSPARTTSPSPPTSRGRFSTLSFPSHHQETLPIMQRQSSDESRKETTNVEEQLGRKRCIKFACVAKKNEQPSPPKPADHDSSQEGGARRPCMLRFVCPMKPTRTDSSETTKSTTTLLRRPPMQETATQPTSMPNEAAAAAVTQPISKPVPAISTQDNTTTGLSKTRIEPMEAVKPSSKPFNHVDFQKCEATRFNEFASMNIVEDEWTNEQTAYRKRMTINDTLQKENAIRKLAEEADEEEALDEDDDDNHNDDRGLDDEDEDEEEAVRRTGSVVSLMPQESFDDGNESDDEDGFAESDDESEDWSSYQFWTPGLTTAATSTDHIEHIRSSSDKVHSDSSLHSSVKHVTSSHPSSIQINRHERQQKVHSAKVQLPKDDDFIIGTLDEDRPLEDAYLSSLEQRKNTHKKIIPQDIDPSFPTSDPEDRGDNGSDSDEEDTAEESVGQDMHRRRTSSPMHQSSRGGAEKSTQSNRNPSPKRCRSPPPPPNRRLFGQATHRLRSPPPMHKRLASPPSSRRPSPRTGSPIAGKPLMIMPNLAQRPNLTHTASLPRMPNPYWQQHNRASKAKVQVLMSSPQTSDRVTVDKPDFELHTRGPIDIVQGLENKRQRRKEKFWRRYCQRAHAGKEKERKCHPGKGAQRMREVGMEMQDRFKGYGRRGGQLVLSV